MKTRSHTDTAHNWLTNGRHYNLDIASSPHKKKKKKNKNETLSLSARTRREAARAKR